MGMDDAPLDDKAKRTRDLLSSFYSPDPSTTPDASSKQGPLDSINTTSFDADQYMDFLLQKSNLEGLLKRHVEMAAEMKNLDTDLQMLVYENYSKFISATDTIKRMNSNIVGMETNMEQLLDKIMSVQTRSDAVNGYLFQKREHIEKLHRTRNLLRKIQFIYDLPARLEKCIKLEAYADAVRFYTGAMPIFKAYGDSSFQDCKQASEETIAKVVKILQGKLFSDSESVQARAEGAVLLKQLDFPVDDLQAKLLEKLEQSLGDLQLGLEDIANGPIETNNSFVQSGDHEASVREFAEAIRAYRVIFPESEKQLIKLSHDLITKHFEIVEQYVKTRVSSASVLGILRIVWKDVCLMDEVLPEAALTEFSLEVAQFPVKQFVESTFSGLLQDISDALIKVDIDRKEDVEENMLQVALEGSKSVVLQGSMNILLDFHLLLDDGLGLLVKLRDSIIDWVQEGFQDFFKAIDYRFLILSGRNSSPSGNPGLTNVSQGGKFLPGLILVLAQLSIYIEQIVIPKITEEIASSFPGGGARAYENGPAFVPGEICRIFRSAGEKLLHHYVSIRTQRICVLLRKRFTTPNWVKHKEPREVHMFVDMLLQEFQEVGKEVRQILPQGLHKHQRSGSGSSISSRSNPLLDDKTSRPNTHRGRSQLLETHLAKLFKQKVEIFTKVEFTQDSVVSAVVKLCLKSIHEFTRLQTFNRSGFQQIQLDTQFLRLPLKEHVEDGAAVDFLLDEVIVAASERCLDPIPLEPPILDKLIQAKVAKSSEKSQVL